MVAGPVVGRLRCAARLALLGVISMVALSAGAALGANAPAPALPSGSQRVSVPLATGTAAPSRGMAVTGAGTATQAYVGLPGTNAVTHGCSDGNRMEVRLGLMKNTAIYAHCDFP
jgi:hypothetical protein